MAYLSNYLSGPNRRPYRPSSGAYPSVRRYQSPSSFKRDTKPPNESQFSGQDLASALLQQQQTRKNVTPSSSFQNTYDYDPILARIQALSGQSVANAQTDASQLRKEAGITTGDTGILSSLNFDPTTIEAARQNPESLSALLQKEFTQRQADLGESESAQNLLYSGHYVNALNELAQGKASAEGELGARLKELLGGIDLNVLSAQETARQQELDAQLQAAQQAHYYDMLRSLDPSYSDPSIVTGHQPSGGTIYWYDEQGNGHGADEPLPAGWVPKGTVPGPTPGGSIGIWGPPDTSTTTPPPTTAPVTAPPPAQNPLDIYLGGNYSGV